jgi:hypothetical protein
MSPLSRFKDVRKTPWLYFESSREERVQIMDRIIERIHEEGEWWDFEDRSLYPPTRLSRCPLTDIKIVESGKCYEGSLWSPKILEVEGSIPPPEERTHHKFVMRCFSHTPILDLDTADLRHPRTLVGKVFAPSMGGGLNQIIQTQKEIRHFYPNSSWRIYMTTRGLRCVEMGIKKTPSEFFNALANTPSYDSGESQWDKAISASSRTANRMEAAVMPKGDSDGPEDMVVPLYSPPMFHCFVDRPEVLRWINAFPILDIQGERVIEARKDAERFHDDRIMGTMTEERWDFAWSELRRRMSSVDKTIKKAIEEWVGNHYKESKL